MLDEHAAELDSVAETHIVDICVAPMYYDHTAGNSFSEYSLN